MAEISDEDRLIRILQQHKALKEWTIARLLEQGIECKQTYGNDEKGDIIVIHSEDGLRVQQLLDEFQQRFNPSYKPIVDRPSRLKLVQAGIAYVKNVTLTEFMGE